MEMIAFDPMEERASNFPGNYLMQNCAELNLINEWKACLDEHPRLDYCLWPK